MKILVINAGSSSLKFGVFDPATDARLFEGEFEDFARSGSTLSCHVQGDSSIQSGHSPASDIKSALTRLPSLLADFGFTAFDAIAHRVVHGGARFRSATLIDAVVLRDIAQFSALAPLHNPLSLLGINTSAALWPTLPQIAVFDTAFHQSIPDYAYTYAIPAAWRERGLRRYGFHGISHQYVGLRVARELQRPLEELRIVSCHLGSGASVCAISHGRSLDTSMGMTPLEGLVMATRAGDVDPGMFAFLARECGLDAAAVEQQLNSASGLLALAGTTDMREIEQRATAGVVNAQLALHIYAYRVRKYIGAYAAAMGGVDVVAFTGGVGANCAALRRRICEHLDFLGLRLDAARNDAPALDNFAAAQIQSADSRISVIVTRTDEQAMIAREAGQLLQARPTRPRAARIPVAVSARHVHLSQAAINALFGKDHQLTLDRKTHQAEGWAAVETVELIGPKGTLSKVRVVGPIRPATQIEVSRTDTFTLGIDAPLRDSGALANTPKVRLRGPAGDYDIDGLIVAARHIHLNTADATRLGLVDGTHVDVRLDQGERATIFANTRVRVKDSYTTEMHIDTDEANAAGITGRSSGEVILG